MLIFLTFEDKKNLKFEYDKKDNFYGESETPLAA